MSIQLTASFFANARGLTFKDGGGITWTLNPNTNEVTGDTGAGGATAANPTAKVGASAVNGTAGTWMRSDAAPPIDLAANFAWSGKAGWFGATAIVQPTTAIAASTFIQVDTATVVSTSSTFDGYTLKQVVKAFRNLGLLA